MSLNEKARTLNELFWENVTEWKKWLRSGLTEPSQSELSAKYQEKWVRLEDVEHEIEKIHRKYEMVISTAEKDCAECFQASKASKQKLQQLLNEFPDINDKKYELPDGWTSHDIVDVYRIFYQDVFAWKRKLEKIDEKSESNEPPTLAAGRLQ